MNTNTPIGLTGSSNSHARLSPSDSKRWTSCTASIAYQEANAHRVLQDNGSSFSKLGTEAHEWAAKLLLNQITPTDIPEEFAQPVLAYVQRCLPLVPEGIAYQVEVVVPLFYQPEQTGTCDFAVITDERVTIVDYKHGAGVLVSSDENTQLAIYAFSLIQLMEDLYNFSDETEIHIEVFQPNHREGHAQSPWVTTLADLRKFCWDIEHHAIQARVGADRVYEALRLDVVTPEDTHPERIMEIAPMVRFHPEEGDGGSCRWCKCKAFCAVRASALSADMPSFPLIDALAVMPDLTKDEKKLDVADRIDVAVGYLGMDIPLPDDVLVKLFGRTKAITSFLSDIGEYLEARALEGNIPEGLKLVMGREGNRAWANEEAADTFLAGQKISADERYTRKLISPTQAEKLLPENISIRAKTRFKELVTRSAAKKVLALADDKRESVLPDVSVMPDMEFEV